MVSNKNKKSTSGSLSLELESSAHSSLLRAARGNQFLNRNRTPLTIYAVIFLCIGIVCHVLLKNAQDASRHEIYDSGVLSAETIAEKVTAPLLGKDVLTLNVAVGELEKKYHPVFTAILDHDDKIIAHSDPNEIGKTYTEPANKTKIRTDRTVTIERMIIEGKSIISFSKILVFSKVPIGKIRFGLDAGPMDQTIAGYERRIFIIWGICAVCFTAAVYLTDMYLKNKQQKILEEIEKTRKVGPYLLTKKIAQGGMAELYLAEYMREDGFRRTVAVKKILPHLIENRDFVDMFIREARLAAILQHPNIVQIYDLIKLHNAHFMAMEYVPGKNLAEVLAHEKKGLPVGMATFIIQKISLGLYYSHTRTSDDTGEPLNIVHRDVSTQNMLISFKGEVKISDFGISKARSEPSLTRAGVIKGKLSYLAPEQALGKGADHQSDLYALGIIFYEILSGKRLYKFENELEALSTLPKMVVPPINTVRTDIPEELNQIVMKCLEKDPGKRYESGKRIYDDLAQFRKKRNISFDETNLIDFMTKRFK
ncbi:protein kinase domain-containing protein [Desulfobacter curvatus]|uniref:protein kinase domain-containing protein n=1 Tax=Desulfobacter curvatus TaxID=2290 RepID=UPI00036752AC|nr:protein kinase [Desulfobacter curvatus]